MKDQRPEGPMLRCEILTCNAESLSSGYFERHEMAPGDWKWICIADVWVVEEGK